MLLGRLPFLPAFLEEGCWHVFGVLVFAADAAEDEEANDEGADCNYNYYCHLHSTFSKSLLVSESEAEY